MCNGKNVNYQKRVAGTVQFTSQQKVNIVVILSLYGYSDYRLYCFIAQLAVCVVNANSVYVPRLSSRLSPKEAPLMNILVTGGPFHR